MGHVLKECPLFRELNRKAKEQPDTNLAWGNSKFKKKGLIRKEQIKLATHIKANRLKFKDKFMRDSKVVSALEKVEKEAAKMAKSFAME